MSQMPTQEWSFIKYFKTTGVRVSVDVKYIPVFLHLVDEKPKTFLDWLSFGTSVSSPSSFLRSRFGRSRRT